MINRKFFYETIKSPEIALFSFLNQKQVDGFEAIFNEWEHDPTLTDMRQLAYMLATAYHETAYTMQPVKERGKELYFIERYFKNEKVRKQLMNLSAQDAVNFCGKGHVQLTGRRNYELFEKRLNIPLSKNSDLALVMVHSITIMFEGMQHGLYTGKKLKDYFNGPELCDWKNARRIINGLDCADDIAMYAKKFLMALSII